MISHLFTIVLTLSLLVCVQSGPMETALFPVPVGDKVGFIDKTGNLVIEPHSLEFANGSPKFCDGLIAFKEAGKWGYINTVGHVVIAPRFSSAASFSEGLAAVKSDSGWGFIDKSGKWIISPKYRIGPGKYTEGLVRVVCMVGFMDDNSKPTKKHEYQVFKYGYLDRTGKLVVRPLFDDAYDFSEGMARVEINKKSGFVDRKGHLVVKPIYTSASDFREGLAGVCLSGKHGDRWGFINKTGKMVIRPRYAFSGDFHEGLAPVCRSGDPGGRWGYINKAGSMVIRSQFESASEFSESLAAASRPGKRPGFAKYGFIDKTGRWIIKPLFGNAGSFSEGLAVASYYDDGQYGYINRSGRMVIKPIYHNAEPFINGIAKVELGGPRYLDQYYMAYLDRTGKYIWKDPRFGKQHGIEPRK